MAGKSGIVPESEILRPVPCPVLLVRLSRIPLLYFFQVTITYKSQNPSTIHMARQLSRYLVDQTSLPRFVPKIYPIVGNPTRRVCIPRIVIGEIERSIKIIYK